MCTGRRKGIAGYTRMYSCVQGGERGELGTLECIHVYRGRAEYTRMFSCVQGGERG